MFLATSISNGIPGTRIGIASVDTISPWLDIHVVYSYFRSGQAKKTALRAPFQRWCPPCQGSGEA